MATETVTDILKFGEGGADASGLFLAEIDRDMHLDAAGKPITTFPPGTPVYVLHHHDPEIKVIGIKDTDGGDLQQIGTVTRQRTVQLTFQHAAQLVKLPHRVNGLPTAVWYGNSSALQLVDGQLKAAAAPCIGEITYSFTATQYLYRPPTTMTVEADETFPVVLVTEYEEEE